MCFALGTAGFFTGHIIAAVAGSQCESHEKTADRSQFVGDKKALNYLEIS